ncbi:MAG: hypothetical protein KatS3mg094_418 [Candidatus Parcubacteria bacterium]|nr:MAG: hypothetical protein KatS3mg094_418 [Candidatus Parcubacteria bacterium]
MKKSSLIYLATFVTILSLLPVVNLNFVSAQTTCDPDSLRPVSFGQRGSAVANLQACLMEAGYDIPAISGGQASYGYYGQQTADAVLRFYEDNGVSAGVRLRGRNFGSQGVSLLKQQLTDFNDGGTEEDTNSNTGNQGNEEGRNNMNNMNNMLGQLLPLLLSIMNVQLDATTTQQLLTALSNNDMLTAFNILNQIRSQTKTTNTGSEGNLTVERSSQPVNNVPLREGDTQVVLGLRFRATQGDVTVQRIRINWPTNVDAPFRVLSRVELVDDSGASLWSSNVTSADGQPFYRETNGQYYLLITGINVNVTKDQTKNVYLKVTAVSTYPSNVSNTVQLTVPDSIGIRAVTGPNGSINLFGPNTPVSNSFQPQTTLAQSASLSVVRTSDTPQERNVVANELVSGTGTAAVMRLTQDVPLIKFRMTAQNDKIMLRTVVATFTNSTIVPANFYLDIGGRRVGSVSVSGNTVTFDNLFSDNVAIDRDQSVDGVIGVSWVDNVSYTGGNLTLTVATTTFESYSLGAVKSVNPNITSFPVNFYTVAPNFSFAGNVSATRDQNLTTTTLSFTGSITVSVPNNVHAGGQVRISSSSPFALQWEFSNTSATSNVSYIIQNVRDANNNLVSQNNGYYVLNAGDSYKFELTAQYIAAGNFQGRVRVNSIIWEPGNGGNWAVPQTSTYVSRDFVTGFSN